MLTSASKAMPAIDYVSLIRSVYADRRALLIGAFASAFAALLSGLSSASIALCSVAVLILGVGLLRYANMAAFWRADVADDDVHAAEYWERRAMGGGALVALAHGLWCVVAVNIVQDPFAEVASCTLSVAASVGIVARNFGLDRLVSVQIIALSVPMWLAFMLRGDINYIVLATLLVVMLISFRKLAGDIRALLLAAVHGRQDATRLAEDLDIALDTMTHGVMMVEPDGTICLVNDRARDILARLGIALASGERLPELFSQIAMASGRAAAGPARILDLVRARGSGKVLLCLSPGRYFEVTVSSETTKSVLLFEDISDRIKTEERINFMARYDTLTGLANRTYFADLINEDLAERAEAGQAGESVRNVALLLVDLDDFKHVNDTLGHGAGDALLKAVAERLRPAVGERNVLARLGGDEFVIYMPHLEHAAAADAVAARVLECFARPFELDDVVPVATATMGVVVSQAAEDDLDGLMARADLALYQAKADGKRRFQRFHPGMDVDYQYRQNLKADLAEAIANDALDLAFQPLVEIQTGRVVSCEALVRWTHPQWGAVSPAIFVPLAEEMGLISKITAFMLHRASAECVRWPSEISVAVNMSARDFSSGDIGGMVGAALQASGLAPERLELEVTESALIEQREVAINELRQLARRGIAIALDDFGTGYSSLSYLQALPFTKLKIDRSFLNEIETRPRALRLLANVARLGTELDMVVIAEGVETETQLELLRAHTQVQQVQGYYFSRPLPARDITELISRLNGSAEARPLRNVVNQR